MFWFPPPPLDPPQSDSNGTGAGMFTPVLVCVFGLMCVMCVQENKKTKWELGFEGASLFHTQQQCFVMLGDRFLMKQLPTTKSKHYWDHRTGQEKSELTSTKAGHQTHKVCYV